MQSEARDNSVAKAPASTGRLGDVMDADIRHLQHLRAKKDSYVRVPEEVMSANGMLESGCFFLSIFF